MSPLLTVVYAFETVNQHCQGNLILAGLDLCILRQIRENTGASLLYVASLLCYCHFC